jgi:hypothetical protein
MLYPLSYEGLPDGNPSRAIRRALKGDLRPEQRPVREEC